MGRSFQRSSRRPRAKSAMARRPTVAARGTQKVRSRTWTWPGRRSASRRRIGPATATLGSRLTSQGLDGHQLPGFFGLHLPVRPAMEALGDQLATLGIENHGQILDFVGDGGSDRGRRFHAQDRRLGGVGEEFGRRDPDPHPGERPGADAHRHQVQVGGSPAGSVEQFPHPRRQRLGAALFGVQVDFQDQVAITKGGQTSGGFRGFQSQDVHGRFL